ncbi:MAG TPA: ferredoxin-thioredoxin reductase catalytic domain-containing protein [Syntrophorhabdaceae bacterium]|nr:ferredoxin-thioredoxin reductase catalytic domain-containing protein [Syntrophorhabdaceae bacterium]HPU30283.1 ferredoxin-thioredoxin reductase catalytic domain-containing protein [Syntrophorhabdaceae bacterium]
MMDEEAESFYQKIKKEAEASGYYLNPDITFTKDLIKGLLINEKRYGYLSCPCRLARGIEKEDKDIICPCDYRDADLNEYGFCYCGLFVTKDVIDNKKNIAPIPERRGNIPRIHVWRCRICGYLCARGQPPEICPICKAKNDRFERFLFSSSI